MHVVVLQLAGQLDQAGNGYANQINNSTMWKFSELRPKQLLVINRFCTGSDVFVALPTGSGKSVC